LGKLTQSVSVALLAVPPVGVTVAVLLNLPEAVGLTRPVMVYVIELPAGRLAPVWLILPVPEAAKPLAPPVCVADQVSPVTSAGIGSAIVVPVAAPVPPLWTTTV
jgi:hypothetical protein